MTRLLSVPELLVCLPQSKPLKSALPSACCKRVALLGGLVTDANGQVKAADGTLIDGLFAAGNCSGPFYGGIDYSLFTMGMSLGRCVTGGYVTGEYVAKL